VLVHGDAAFAGQGVVMETLALAQTRGYYTGGTVHIVINNQIGFTTSDPRDSRSTLYCSDVVKMIEAPVLHVNGDDPEAVVLATQLALDYRMEFNKDVVVDIICFRKLGHNEQDTPALTQPLMYKKIAQHPGTRKLYGDKLAAQGVLRRRWATTWSRPPRRAGRRQEHVRPGADQLQEQVRRRLEPVPEQEVDRRRRHRHAAGRMEAPGRAHHHHPRRLHGAPAGQEGLSTTALPWAAANQRRLGHGRAHGLCLAGGQRLPGAPVGRGLRPRHLRAPPCGAARPEPRKVGRSAPTCRCRTWPTARRPFVVIDSILSEEAVLGFEYGYASNDPNTLVIWEAQFGDFVNGAQVVIDQFIARGEVKWGRVNGITLMLPHGYEGQGPEHSSARLERFMQLAADTNMQVVQPTTASQIFHLLRRQMVRSLRKPLVIMTPKSLLRAKDATSPLSEFTKGEFQTVIPERKEEVKADKVKRVIACSGKVYYDLMRKKREREGLDDVAIVRVEQLYPFPHKAFAAELKRYPNATDIVWCQDEPQNQGAWFFVQHYIHENMLEGRSSAIPAAGIGLARGGLFAPAPGAAKGAAGDGPSASSRASSSPNKPPTGRRIPEHFQPHMRTIMAIVEVKVPQLSESVAEATLLPGRRSPATPWRSMKS
jgi:2-oxoglutarate dehydrogenase E1 component